MSSASSPQPPTKPHSGSCTSELLHGCKAGLILICDIVDFSKRSRPQQTAAIDRLWQYINDPHWVEKLGQDRLVNGTGDGFMIACPDHKTEVTHADFIRFAEEMVHYMARSRPQRVGLRVGVHQGAFDQMKLRFLSGKSVRQGVGKGINRCARIVAIGDEGDITVSEDFITEWEDASEQKIGENFSPRPPNPPFEVVVKHGETIKIRFYRPANRRNRPWPAKIKMFRSSERKLRDHLELIAHGFEYYARQIDDTLTPQLIDIRVSIFAEGPDGDDPPVLSPTQFRFHALDHDTQLGSTRYSISGSGAGPLGRAYVDRQIQILAHLPAWEQKRKDYIAALEKTGLDPATVKAFRRHARTFVAVPFGMLPGHPDGVICIDAMSPLDSLSDERIWEMANFLRDQFCTTIAALWRLRGQI